MPRLIQTNDNTNNKHVIQSYLLTEAKYNFSVYEKRILYRLVELAQCEIQGIKIANNKCRINRNLFGHLEVEMSYTSILDIVGEKNAKNHEQIKKAARSLSVKLVEIEDIPNKQYWCYQIIHTVHCDGKNGYISFQVDDFLWTAILDFTKGFRKFELKTAMSFKSPYTMRFYEIIAGQKQPWPPNGFISVDELKYIFGVQKKYKLTADFIRYVIEPAKRELDNCSPYSFEYSLKRTNPKKPQSKIIGFVFYPVYQPKYRDEDLEKKSLQMQVSPSWDLSYETLDYLKNSIGFTTDEIKHNIDLWKEAQQKLPDLIEILALLKGKSREKDNPKGWIIRAIEGKVNDSQK